MDISDLHPPDDYSHRFFIWHEWLQAHGPLTTENVFDYFVASMFYDKQSNNQVLRMQTIHTGQVLNEGEDLKRFTGIEFAVVHAEPPSLFIIHKRERLSPEEARPLAAYFIINNRVYQSPDVYTILSNRLLTTVNALQSSLDTLRRHRPDYTPRTGFIWPIVDTSLSEDASKKRDADEELLESDEEEQDLLSSTSSVKRKPASNKHQNNTLMYNAMRTTAAHTSATMASRVQVPPPSSDIVVPETPVPSTGARSSATPAPTVDREAKGKPAVTVPNPQEAAPPVRGPPGGGKKKKKRTGSMAT